MRQSPEREPTLKSLPTDLIEIGQVVGSFGLRGQLKVNPSTDFLNRFDVGQSVHVKDVWYKIDKSSLHKGRPLLKLKGIDSIEKAETLKWEIVRAAGAPDLEEGEYLVQDLVGLQVVTDEGQTLGVVDEILPYPTYDILVVGTVMIPLIKEFVKEIDPESERILVHLIPGMVSD